MRGSGLSGRRARFRSVPLLCVGRGTGTRRGVPVAPVLAKEEVGCCLDGGTGISPFPANVL